MHSYVVDTMTSHAPIASLEQAHSKNMSQICWPPSFVIWQNGFLSCMEAN